jgi:hypothetical protein
MLRRVCGSDGPLTVAYSVAWFVALALSVLATAKPW